MDTNRLFEFFTNHWVLSLLLVVILIALSMEPLLRRLRGIKRVSAVESTRLINQENAQVIDIREDKEFAKEHILDSRSAPLTSFPNRIEALDSLKGYPLILVWTTGQQAMRTASQLHKRGHKPVYVLQGGIESWREAKMPLFSGNVKTKASPQPKLSKQPEATVRSEANKQPEVTAQPEASKQPEIAAQSEVAAAQPDEVRASPEIGAAPETGQPKTGAQARSGKKPKGRKKARAAKKSRARRN